MSDYIHLRQQDFSFLGKGSLIKGEFHLKGPTRIAARIEGNIHMQENTSLTIELDGEIKGSIHCQRLDVYGKVEGEIISSEKVTFHSPSHFSGKISAKELVIRPGADLNMDGHTVEP